ncbi:hypothetical protein [Chelatococcus reniformis]|uniref:Uncharacterized protein n=1 Tax=Chelatococcus reniformis TaxID=1494448 RepID=A0A916UBC1_9HYPH|nr:hypothetical protein [Chelatococcus reniformis]GGC67432.1 hypothetical protein GCM10010994_27550 [Chelatococcus reniformis]
MKMRIAGVGSTMLAGAMLAGAMFAAASPASALTMQECSAKYNAAKTAGTLGTQKWNDFRKAECGEGAAAPAAAAGGAPAAAAPAAAAPAAAPAAAGSAVFPSAISTKYSSEKPGVARRKTCSDQYQANKTSNGNGGLKWIQKGGGYYSECNKHLKG